MRLSTLLVLLAVVVVGCNHKEAPNTAAVRLHQAARTGDLALVQSLVAGGCDVDARDKNGDTPLFTAAGGGHASIVRFLIAEGADVNTENLRGGTPLHRAASSGHAGVAQLLIDAGADVNAGKDRDCTPLYAGHYALADQDHEDVVRLLLASGAEVVPGGTLGNGHLLYFAVERAMHDLVEKLLAAGANPNTISSGKGMIVLGEAVARGDTEAARLLIAYGADVNGKDAVGRVPLHHARSWSRDVVELLLAKGAEVNGRFLLHFFVDAGEKEIIEVCLAHGADVNDKDLAGQTPLDVAIGLAPAREEIVALLKKHGGIQGR